VHLTSGNNLLLNTLLASTSLNDSIPLHWRNQVALRVGFSVPLRESFHFEGAYAYANNPVPSSTVTPLTAAIMSNALSTGLTYAKSRYKIALGYQVNLPATANVGNSQILAGEYDNSQIRVWLQTVALTTGVRF
jgi:long-chain fatty acid transport protein